MAKRPSSFTTPNFSVRVNRWPFLTGRRISRRLGMRAAVLIRKRLRKGRQADGRPLPPYSDVYRAELRRAGEGTRRDLELSGALVAALRVLKYGRKGATVGWNRSSRSPNTIRTKGGTRRGRGTGQKHRAIVRRLTRGEGSTKPRAILGLTKADKKKLARWLRDRHAEILRVR